MDWRCSTRAYVCAALILGSPYLGAAAVTVWWFAIRHLPVPLTAGYGPAYGIAIAAALGSTAGVTLLPGPPHARLAMTLSTTLGGTFLYAIGFRLYAANVLPALFGP